MTHCTKNQVIYTDYRLIFNKEKNMIDVLTAIERELPTLLNDQDGWKGLYADSEKPHLKRLWRPWNEYRINLHHFTACQDTEEFPHPHPWKMVVRILEGTYLMGLGRASDLLTPPKMIYKKYYPGEYYEMLEEDEWHAIRPLGAEALTIMVSGPPIYQRNKMLGNKPSRELNLEERSELFKRIRVHYPA